MKERNIIVALDGMNFIDALDLARELQGLVWGFKISDLLERSGIWVVASLGNFGNIMVDTKVYDIGNTVANRIKLYADAGATLATISADAWDPAMHAAAAAKGDMKVLAVTVLSSMNEIDVRAKYNYWDGEGPQRRQPIREEILKLTERAVACGLDGVVCSPAEVEFLKNGAEWQLGPTGADRFGILGLPDGFLKVTPNIRLASRKIVDDDQNLERSATPRAALSRGATHLVIGRPITRSASPRDVVERIVQELQPSS